MDLGEAITVCRTENALSARTADLCSVVRSYRNLIHPGRLVRLGEEQPSKTSCDIAVALIELIVAEIARNRRAAVGLTGEQILSKLLRDPNCLVILSHLLAETNDEQRFRLAKTLLPDEYMSNKTDDPFDDVPERLEGAFRIVLDSLTEEHKRAVAGQFVHLLKEADGDRITRYRDAFFRSSDLAYLQAPSQAMVKDHLLGAPSPLHSFASIKVLDGIGEYLQSEDSVKWFDPMIRTLISSSADEFLKKRVRQMFFDTITDTSKVFDESLARRINDWILHFEKLTAPNNLAIVKELQEELRTFGAP